MDISQDFKSFQEKVQAALVAVTRSANQIAAEDLSFQKTSNPAVEEQLDETSERLLALASSLLKSASQKSDLRAPNLEDADDIDVHWTRVVDIVDSLLEKADTCLDDYTGLIKRNNAPADDSVRLRRQILSVSLKEQAILILHALERRRQEGEQARSPGQGAAQRQPSQAAREVRSPA